MSLDPTAVVAGWLAAVTVLVLLLAVIGAHTIARAVHAWADQQRAIREWRRSTGPVLVGDYDLDAAWDDAQAINQPQHQPDLPDPRHGTDDHLLNQCYRMWHNTSGGDQ